MSKKATPWLRPLHQPSERPAEILWVVWLPTRDLLLSPSASRDGITSAGANVIPELDLRFIDDAPWLGGWLLGPFGRIGGHVGSRIELSSLHGAAGAMVLRDSRKDPPDLAALQASVAVCKALSHGAALAALDVYGHRWWHPQALRDLDPSRAFDVQEHVTIVFETTEREGERGHWCHTRGMKKFARPEVLMRGLAPMHANPATRFLNEVAHRMAEGKRYDGRSLVRIKPPGAPLPTVGFREIPDDSDDPAPMFVNACLEVVDFDESAEEALDTCDRLLAALEGWT